MKRILSEPLLHFVLLGALLFVAYEWRNPDQDRETIVVSAGQIDHLITRFARTWQRPPTGEELQGLVNDYVVDEMLSREAIKLGLDRDDIVIRRRLRQKMEFIGEDLTASEPPDDAELESYLRDHPDRFREPARYTFEHVFISSEREDIDADAASILSRLKGGADPASLGDRLMLPRVFRDASARDIDSEFGPGFAEQLGHVDPGVWAGPLSSGYGAHLVRVDAVAAPRMPALSEVRDDVEREYVNARREVAQEKMLEILREQYTVVVEPYADAEGVGAPGGEGSQ